MRDSDFDFIRTLVYERSRISLDRSKRELVTARVAKRLRAHGIDSIADYCQMLRSPDHEEERARLIDAISTNHTFFFREAEHFKTVEQVVVPEMRERARREPWPRLHAWSAACSSGEEPYSLGMTLDAALAGSGWSWCVQATDISRRVLEKAEAAIYPSDAVRDHIPPWARRYFQRGVGPREGFYRIHPTIRAGVRFQQLNLLEGPLPFAEPFQLIFCRNVLIYFDRPTQAELIGRLTQMLVPGGYLMVGHSETLNGIDHRLESLRGAVYRRPRPRP